LKGGEASLQFKGGPAPAKRDGVSNLVKDRKSLGRGNVPLWKGASPIGGCGKSEREIRRGIRFGRTVPEKVVRPGTLERGPNWIGVRGWE